MPLDPSIALQAKGVTLPDPIQMYGNALGLANAQQQLQTNQLGYQQAEAAAGERNSLRDYFADPKNAGKDAATVQAEILSRAPTTGGAVLKSIAENRKMNLDADSVSQGTAQKGQEASVSAFVAQPNLSSGVQALLDGVRTKAWSLDDIAPLIQHVGDGTLNNDNFAEKRQALNDRLRTAQERFTSSTPTPTQVDDGQGGKIFRDTNPVTNPGIVGTRVAGNPTVIRGEQGEVLRVAPGGQSYSQVPAGAPGSPSGASPFQVPPTVQASRDSDRVRIPQDELSRETNPEARAAIQTELARRTGAPVSKGASAGAYPTTVPANLMAANTRMPGTKDFNATEDAKNAGKYEADLNESVQSGRSLMALNTEFQKAMQNYQTGPGAPTRLAIAKTLAGLGVSKEIVDKINRGDLSNAQEIQKLGAQGAMQALKTSMDGQGRISQAEFQIFKQNNPSIELDPNAIQKIQQFQAQQYQKTFAEQQALADYRSKGGNPAQWPAVWSQMLDQQGKAQPAISTDAVGTPGATFANRPPQAAIVETRIAPDGRKVAKFADGTIGYVK